MEMWKKICDYDNYEVSSLGRIRNIKTGRVLKPVRRGRYLAVNLCDQGWMKTININRLVASAFLGGPPDEKTNHAAHWDGDPHNNRVENLRWATCLENTDDRRRHGRIARGESQGLSKLTEEAVRYIRSSDKDALELSKLFKVERRTIYAVRLRRTWDWVV